MPAVSKKQQRFFGIVRAAQKGTLKGKKTLKVQRAASSMKKKDVKKFASTKHKGLPEKKVTKESFNEDYVKELEDGLVKLDYPTYDEVDELMKKIAKDNGIDTTVLHMAFKTKHLMVPDDWAKKKMMEPVMIPKITGDVKEDLATDAEKVRVLRGPGGNPVKMKDKINSMRMNHPLGALKVKYGATNVRNYYKSTYPKIGAERAISNVNKYSSFKGNDFTKESAHDETMAASQETVKQNIQANKFKKQKRLPKETIKRMNKPEGQFNSFEPDMSMVDEAITAKERFKRDAGKIAKNKLRQKEHEKYVNFLNVDEAVNRKQQAAIAISKKQRLMDLMVAKKKKKKLKEEQNPEGIKLSDVKKRQRQEQLKKASKKVPVVTNKIVPLHKESSYAEFEKRSGVKAVTPKKKVELPKTPEKKSEGTFASGNPVGKANVGRKILNVSPGSKREVASRGILGKIKHVLTGEEVIYEYDGNYHMNKIAKEKKLDLTDPRQRRRANSLARHNAAKGNVNNPMGRKKRKKKRKLLEGNLHKWFKGSKSKDGKGGWVNVVTGGTCASDEPGEGTPKCVSSSKRASMTKAERLSASRRKKKADPNQQSKSGAAKPTYVSTDKKKVKKESYIPEEGYDHIKDRIAMAGGNPSSKKKKDATTIKKDYKDYKREIKGDTDYQKKMRKKYGGRMPTAFEIVRAKYGKGAIMGEENINELETKTMLNYIDKASDSATKLKAKADKYHSKKEKLGSKKPKKAAKLNTKAVNAIKKMEKREDNISLAKDKIMKRQEDKTLTSLKRSYEGPDAVREEKKVMGKIKRSFKRDEYGDPIKPDGSYAGKLNVDKNPKDEKITRSEGYVVEAKDLTGNFDKGKKPIKVNLKDLVNKAKNNPKNKNLGVKPPTDTEEVTEAIKGRPLDSNNTPIDRGSKKGIRGKVAMPVREGKSPAWQRKAGKSESGGLNAKGVASYRAANPGSKLKTAVTTKPSKLKKGSKSSKRRLSFCRRMKGMKKKLTSAKTARDPDSRINKSLRKWNCSFEPETGEMIMERGPQTLGFGTRKSSIHNKKKKSTKKVSGMIKSLKRKGTILKQSMGPLDASRKASRLKNLKDDVDLTILRLIDEGHMNKTCGEGEYYCYQSKKCKKIPKGMKIGYGGMLKPDKDDSEETKGKNGNGNGNGNGHGGNGNGNGNGGGDGGGE